ncbi:MAG: tRNA (guanosine(46)-N7)-methyltransferase TrmB [Rhodospirillales bacterium]|nr:tRNA (guanosine(46)-N7)-methyltransferase TrmB [Rhodospirillales bacterium]
MTVDDPERRLIHSYGRRRGRKLRGNQKQLLADALPRVRIAAPGAGEMLDPRALFAPRPASVWLEIGFGAGEHLVAQAAAHPDTGMIGAEPYVNGVVALLTKLEAGRLANIRIWPGDARELIPAFPPASLDRVFILFPDPWPKARHHKRRLIGPELLDALARAMKPGAELRIATDDADYLVWTLERLTGHPAFVWLARGPADWRHRPADWPATRYEEEARAAGRKATYLCFARCLARRPACLESPCLAAGMGYSPGHIYGPVG